MQWHIAQQCTDHIVSFPLQHTNASQCYVLHTVPVWYIFSGRSSVLTQRVSQVVKIFIHSKSQNDDLDFIYYIHFFWGGEGRSWWWIDYLINSFVPKKAWCVSTSVTSLWTAPILVKFSLHTVKMMMLLTAIQSATYHKDIILKKYAVKNLKDISVLFPVTEMINDSHMKIKRILIYWYIHENTLNRRSSSSWDSLLCHWVSIYWCVEGTVIPQNVADCFCNDTASYCWRLECWAALLWDLHIWHICVDLQVNSEWWTFPSGMSSQNPL